jgi:CheY-like chemotaxis protein
MVDSTETTFTFNDQPDKIRRYYSIFINTLAAMIRNFDAKVIKNTGTSLIYYFPKTSSSYDNLSAFKDVIECGISMIAADKVINMKLKEEDLPPMHYKISADYGRVEVARSVSSPDTDDLFGSTMNICAKINAMAPPTGMVIGSDLYSIVKKFSTSSSLFGRRSINGSSSRYHFKKIGEYSISTGFKYQYPVYSVSIDEGKRGIALDLEKQIPQIPLQQKKFSFRATSNAPATIMIVDDEPDILLTYKTYLDSVGYNVDSFTDPREALTHFANGDPNTYNLVLMDIRMPNLNGLQLYYRLKAINPNIKILFVSALDAAQEMVSVLPDIVLDDVIRKPVDNDQFLSKVKAAIA